MFCYLHFTTFYGYSKRIFFCFTVYYVVDLNAPICLVTRARKMGIEPKTVAFTVRRCVATSQRPQLTECSALSRPSFFPGRASYIINLPISAQSSVRPRNNFTYFFYFSVKKSLRLKLTSLFYTDKPRIKSQFALYSFSDASSFDPAPQSCAHDV